MVQGRQRAQRRAPQGRGGRPLTDDTAPAVEPPARLLGEDVIAMVPVRAGTTACTCEIATLASGRSVFVKRPLDDETREANLIEAEVLLRLNGTHAPRLLDIDHADATLVCEDLSALHWAPPMPPADALWRALDATGACTAPTRLRRMRRSYDPWADVQLPWWVAPRRWWDRALPELADAARNARFDGDALVHGDVSPTNLAFDGRRVVLVDWADAAMGSLDWARMLAGNEYRLHGVTVDVPLTDPPSAVAALAGFALRELVRWRDDPPPHPRADAIRARKEAWFASALLWASELLDLAPPTLGPPTAGPH